MTGDIFDNKILCKKCECEMVPGNVLKNGFALRVVRCRECASIIVHPRDEVEYENFMNLRKKQFNVKMRFVGNSYAVSIPREIVNFMQDREKAMDDMVRLCFEEFGRISINFKGSNSSIVEGCDATGCNNVNKGEFRD